MNIEICIFIFIRIISWTKGNYGISHTDVDHRPNVQYQGQVSSVGSSVSWGVLSICIWDASGGFIESTTFIEDLDKMRVRVVCE